ncbi:hypothetical protein CVU75_02565 [Candidatus Dependentiae bacterium HGW-Dependentiae-1]|nr:MAG: hypothetical protein CVU75_02565 [Candidatus Dependentiae bacterium HGW-Dependentiae-1]
MRTPLFFNLPHPIPRTLTKKQLSLALIVAISAHASFSVPSTQQKQIKNAVTPRPHVPLTISPQEALAIGKKIWHNEAGGSTEKLTWWGKNEQCASLGIGHFIWFPADQPVTFTQTFPHLLLFLQQQGAKLPPWLAKNPLQPCPWKNREHFLANMQSTRMIELRSLLVNTIELQVRFIVQRLKQILPAILTTVKQEQQNHLATQFYRVAKSPNGLYALIDYVNFKGEGTNPKETYDDQGWGLKHVLLGMRGTAVGKAALQEFAYVAKQLLTKRTAHAPTERHEEKWLTGWKKRCDTYVS